FSIRIWDGTTGKYVPCSVALPHVYKYAVSPDGQRVAALVPKPIPGSAPGSAPQAWTMDTGCLAVWDIGSGNRVFTFSPKHFGGSQLAWSPDGRRLAIFENRAAGPCPITIFETLRWRQVNAIVHPLVRGGVLAWSPDGKHLASPAGEAIAIWDTN